MGKSGCVQMRILTFRKIMGFISADDPHGKIETNNYKNLQSGHQSTWLTNRLVISSSEGFKHQVERAILLLLNPKSSDSQGVKVLVKPDEYPIAMIWGSTNLKALLLDHQSTWQTSHLQMGCWGPLSQPLLLLLLLPQSTLCSCNWAICWSQQVV